MLSLLATVESALRTFFNQLTDALGFVGYLGLVLGVEVLFIALFVIKSAFSYEARLKRSLDKLNKWLFKNKKIDSNNIKDFTNIVKKGPKRLVYFWQQYILYRDGEPSKYLSEENLIEKPLKTSAWVSNIRNLGILTGIWAVISLMLGLSSQITFDLPSIVMALIFPALVAILGVVAIIALKAKRVSNLDDIYHIYHIFIRFLTNACVDLTPYLDFNLLFTEKELENGSPQLREYYEARARKIKEEFENAQKNDTPIENYKFENVGVDGTLLLNRAMKESEVYISKKNQTLSQIAQIEAQKDALRRNYENVQMDLQRKIQASKENIQKLIEQQAATTSRIEVGLLRQQQEKEVNKRASLQKDYDQEEKRYLSSKDELDKEIQELNKILDEGLDDVQKGMSAEYQTFFEKVMKSAYQVAEAKVKEEKNSLINEKNKNESELISVQTQIKRLKDENDTLRDRLAQYDANYQSNSQPTEQGYYDENGNYIYSDGSYHDTNGLFHDVDGKVYNMNGELVSQDISPEEQEKLAKEEIKNEQIDAFGAYIDENNQVTPAEPINQEEPDTVETIVVAPEEKVEEKTEGTATGEEEKAAKETETSVEEEKDKEPESTEGSEETTAEYPLAIVEPQPEKKKRGRPRKNPASEEKTEESAEPKKRGRPRKQAGDEPKEEKSASPKKRGRPAKSTTTKAKTAENQADETQPKTTKTSTNKNGSSSAKKRGRPRKTTTSAKEKAESTEPKKRGRPRKQSPELSGSFLDKINELISQEENKLKNMKAYFNSEIDQALEPEEKDSLNQEKDDIMSAVESLKEQANQAKSSGQSEELSKVNKRIEDLIKELTNINSGDEGGEGESSDTAQ